MNQKEKVHGVISETLKTILEVESKEIELVEILASCLNKFLVEMRQFMPDNGEFELYVAGEEVARRSDGSMDYNAIYFGLPYCKLFEFKKIPNEKNMAMCAIDEERLKKMPYTLLLAVLKNIVIWVGLYLDKYEKQTKS